MNLDRNAVIDGDEISLRDLLIILLQKWWVVAIVFIVTIAASAAFSFLSSDAYESRTLFLLETSSPLEILNALATSDVLIGSIISELDLRDSDTGNPLGVQQLADMMEVNSQALGQQSGQPGSHLFNLIVKGETSELLKPIADEWARLFVEQSSLLFVTEADRPYGIAFNRFQEASKALREKEDAKLAYQLANPMVTLQSQLEVSTAQYQDYLRQLQGNREALIEAQAMLKSAEEAFIDEPELLTLERAISGEDILALLASIPGEQSLDDVSDLVLADQELNPLHFSLKTEIVYLRANIAGLDAGINYLEPRTAELQTSLERMTSQIEESQLSLSRLDQDIGILTDSFNQLNKSLQDAQIVEGGQQEFVQVFEAAIEPLAPLPKRSRIQILVVGAALGLVLGVALAFLIHYLRAPAILRGG